MAAENPVYQEIPLETIDIPHHRERDGEKFTQLTLNLKTQGRSTCWDFKL